MKGKEKNFFSQPNIQTSRRAVHVLQITFILRLECILLIKSLKSDHARQSTFSCCNDTWNGFCTERALQIECISSSYMWYLKIGYFCYRCSIPFRLQKVLYLNLKHELHVRISVRSCLLLFFHLFFSHFFLSLSSVVVM